MRTFLLCVPLFSCGCESEAREPQAPQGILRVTPRHGVTYYGVQEDAGRIDVAADLWIEWCRSRGIEPGGTVRSCVVSVLTGATLDGTHFGYWYRSGWIEVARDSEKSPDAYMGLHHKGILWLRHEWIHALNSDAGHGTFPYDGVNLPVFTDDVPNWF